MSDRIMVSRTNLLPQRILLQKRVVPKPLMTRLTKATQVVIEEVGQPPTFQPLEVFFKLYEVKICKRLIGLDANHPRF